MIIDSHTHVFPSEVRAKREDFFSREPAFKQLYSVPGSKLSGAEELIRNMDDEGVDKSVIFGFPWNSQDYFKRNNDYVMDAAERYKGRLIGFSAFSPLAEGAEKELERCLESGLSGIGELAFYTSTMGKDTLEALKPIAEVARKHDVPILLHTNESIGHHYPGKTEIALKEIYDLLQNFPDNKIILAHWGGGILFYHLMKRGIKQFLENTWFDTAASPYLYDKDIFSIALKILGPGRILFGSDFPLLTPGRYFEEMKDAGLSEDAMSKICGENAALLLAKLH